MANLSDKTALANRRALHCGDGRLHFWQMSKTITVRLDKELAVWLEATAARTGTSQGQLVREQLEQARARLGGRGFLRLAGAVRGPKDLSQRKGFRRS